jgi:hypothetical protein
MADEPSEEGGGDSTTEGGTSSSACANDEWMGIQVMREVNKRVMNTNRRRIGNLRPSLGWAYIHAIIAALGARLLTGSVKRWFKGLGEVGFYSASSER